jgi:non-heme chloroperoxidase
LSRYLRLGACTQGRLARHDPPFVLKTEDNPEGVDGKVFDDLKAAIASDRYAFFEGFFNNFYNVDVFGGARISDRAWQARFNVAVGSSPFANYACVDTWLTDFRADLPMILASRRSPTLRPARPIG